MLTSTHRKLLLAILFACFGVTAEVIFTSVRYQLVEPLLHGTAPDWKLEGNSYLWMLFIYGSIPILFPAVYSRVKHLNLIFRLAIYAFGIILAEFMCGGLLDILTGNCPWLYTSGHNVMGYAQPDYFPFWMLFGFLIEKAFNVLDTI